MKSKVVGKNTLDVEVTQIDMKGIWVLVDDKEYFLPFERFPSFRDATVGSLHNVGIVSGKLRWPDLNIDLAVETLGEPDKPSLISK